MIKILYLILYNDRNQYKIIPTFSKVSILIIPFNAFFRGKKLKIGRKQRISDERLRKSKRVQHVVHNLAAGQRRISYRIPVDLQIKPEIDILAQNGRQFELSLYKTLLFLTVIHFLSINAF